MKKTIIFLFLVFLLSLPLVLPFFRSGYFPTHDGEWAIVRLGAMHRALMARHFPVRWAGNLNYSFGYPLFLFTYPLPYYLGELFYLAGFGLVGTVKILFVLGTILSGLAMFLLGKELFGNFGGLIGTVFYLYAPFRLVDLYVRGSLGESLAFIFFPLLFWALIRITKGHYSWVAIGAIFFAGLLLTHNVSALLFTPFLVAFMAFLILKSSEKERIFLAQRLLLVFILGIGLAAFFLIPALTEKSNIALSQMPLADIKQHFVNYQQLVSPSWGYGSPGGEDAFSFQLGWVHLGGLLVAFTFWLYNKRRFKNPDSLFFGFSFISLLFLVFLMLPLSFQFWDKAPFFSEVDFPWRALGVATFFLAIGLGYLVVNRLSRFLAIGLAFLVIVVNLNYAKPSGSIDYGDDYYFTNEATTTSNDELMPLWVKQKPLKHPQEKVIITSGEGVINKVFFDAKRVGFDVEGETELEIQINTIYYPGWKLKIDGREAPLRYNPRRELSRHKVPLYNNEGGLITLKVTPGQHRIMAVFGETPVRLLSDFISLASLMSIGGLLIHRLQDKGRNFDLSRRFPKFRGGAQPRMKNPPASVLGEDSIKQKRDK